MSPYHDRLRRRRAATITEVITAITHGGYLHRLGDVFIEHTLGRPRLHPGWVPLAYCALARHFGSYTRLDAELRHGLWTHLTTTATTAGLTPAGERPFQYAHHTYWRDLIIHDTDSRQHLLEEFTLTALDDARHRGLLLPTGGGSLTHPTRSRLIYGDGTIIRPRFRHTTDTGHLDQPNPPDPATPAGEDNERAHRHDPSASTHTRHDGKVYGNNFVFISARGPQRHQRVVLAIGRTPQPGAEAATAVDLIQHVHRLHPHGIQGVVYDGALQGTHIERLMRTTGLIVVNKMTAASRTDTTVVHKRKLLGTYQHPRIRGTTPCTHQLATINGRVADIALADDGTPTIVAHAERQQIKRVRRNDGTYRFNLALRLPCRHAPDGHFTLWLSPHDNPENIRLVPPDDPDFPTIYGLRPDAESLNATLKRTLIIDRAPSIGWERQLYDLIGFAILHNSAGTTPTPHRN